MTRPWRARRRRSPTFATELATKFHAFYRDRTGASIRPTPKRPHMRLALVDATRVTLAAALGTVGDLRARLDVAPVAEAAGPALDVQRQDEPDDRLAAPGSDSSGAVERRLQLVPSAP